MNEIRIRSGDQEKVIPVSRVPELREKVTEDGKPWKGRGKPWVVFAVTFLRAALTSGNTGQPSGWHALAWQPHR